MRWRTWSLPRLARSAGVCEGTNSVSRPCLRGPGSPCGHPDALAFRLERRAGEDRTELIHVRRLEDSRWPSCICAAKLASAIWTVTASGSTGRRARNWPIPFPRRWRLRGACLSLSRSRCPERGPPNMISDGACRHAASARSSGFVLVGVRFLAIMTLLASAAVLWVGRSLDATENRRKALLRELEEHALWRGWLRVHAATQRYTVAGLSVREMLAPRRARWTWTLRSRPLAGSCLWMAGSSAWPMAGALRCSTLRAPQSFRHRSAGCPGCWRGWGSRRAGAGHGRPMVQLFYPGAAPRLGSAAQARSSGQARRRPLRSVMEVFRLEAWRPWEAHLLDAGWRDLVAADEAALNINTADARNPSLPGDYRRTLSADCASPLAASVHPDVGPA